MSAWNGSIIGATLKVFSSLGAAKIIQMFFYLCLFDYNLNILGSVQVFFV